MAGNGERFKPPAMSRTISNDHNYVLIANVTIQSLTDHGQLLTKNQMES